MKGHPHFLSKKALAIKGETTISFKYEIKPQALTRQYYFRDKKKARQSMVGPAFMV